MQHPNIDGLKGWFRTTWFPFINCLPQDQQEGFIDLVIDTYLDQAPSNKDGSIHVAMIRLDVEAVKM